MTDAISTYLTLHAEGLPSADAISARLDHVLDFLESKRLIGATCDDVDEDWIARFRTWSAKQPVMSPKGRIMRKRSLATTEASVAQLSAAINDAHRRRNARYAAGFRAQKLRDLNQSPQHRSDIAELASMFRYCVAPDVSRELQSPWGRRQEPYSAAELLEIRRRERAALHRFLIISIATLARPDAAVDVSLQPARRQWISNARILALNPAGRRQTKKYRATVSIAHQVAPWLDGASKKGFFVGPGSIRKAWERMAKDLGLPGDREAGTKLIRRSMAKLLRDRLAKSDWPEVVMFLGHAQFDQTSDIYAPFDPNYLSAAKAGIEAIIDEIEGLCPGAFSRTIAGAGADVVPIRRGKNA